MNAQRALFRLLLTACLFFIIAASIMLTIENNYMIQQIYDRQDENLKEGRTETNEELYG